MKILFSFISVVCVLIGFYEWYVAKDFDSGAFFVALGALNHSYYLSQKIEELEEMLK